MALQTGEILTIINMVFTIVIGIGLALGTHFWTPFFLFRKAIPEIRLKRVQEQLSTLYGPVLMSLQTQEASWQAFRKANNVPSGMLFKKYYMILAGRLNVDFQAVGGPQQTPAPSRELLDIRTAFLRHLRRVFLPLLRNVCSIIQKHAHLLFEESGIPADYVQLVQSVALLDALVLEINNKSSGDVYETVVDAFHQFPSGVVMIFEVQYVMLRLYRTHLLTLPRFVPSADDTGSLLFIRDELQRVYYAGIVERYLVNDFMPCFMGKENAFMIEYTVDALRQHMKTTVNAEIVRFFNELVYFPKNIDLLVKWSPPPELTNSDPSPNELCGPAPGQTGLNTVIAQ